MQELSTALVPFFYGTIFIYSLITVDKYSFTPIFKNQVSGSIYEVM